MTAIAETTAGPPGQGSGGLTHRQIMTILSGLLLGMFLAALDQTIVSTAMRTIADRLDGQTAQAWVTTSYLVTSTVSTPLYGKLSDLYGRKPFFLFAIGIFVVGSILCGLAQSIYELAAYRALQGIGAGGLMSLAFAIVGDIVPPANAVATRRTSCRCSRPRASSVRSSAASSPGRTASPGSTAGAGSST